MIAKCWSFFFFFLDTEFLPELGFCFCRWFHGRVLGVGKIGIKYSSVTSAGGECQGMRKEEPKTLPTIPGLWDSM